MKVRKMTVNIQILLGLLMVSQLYCLEKNVFRLRSGERLSVDDTSVKFGDFRFNQTQIKSIIEYKINGAIGNRIQNLTLHLDATFSMNVDSENHLYVDKCQLTLTSPKNILIQRIFEALEKLIYHNVCTNPDGSNNIDFGTIVGNNNVHLNTIESALEVAKKRTIKSVEKYDERQRGIDTLVDMALSIGLSKLQNFSYIKINDIAVSNLKLSNVEIGNFSTLSRAKPFEIYRQGEVLTVVAAFKIRLQLFLTTEGKFWKIPIPAMKFTALAEKIEVGITMKFDYSVKPCRIVLEDMNLEKEKLAILLLDQFIVGPLMNPVLSVVEKLLTPARLIPPIKAELQKLLDGDNVKSEFEVLRPVMSMS